MEVEERQLVLCTVEKIIGTVVFVRIEGNGEGTIVTSEISPGRIRNLRDYVVPGKKIVCKVLKKAGNQIHLSLRRVKLSEKKAVLDRVKKTKNISALIKSVLNEKAESIIDLISKKHDVVEFIEESKSNPQILEEFIPKNQAEKIIEILKSKKEREVELKKAFNLSSKEGNGMIILKEIIKKSQESLKEIKAEVSYIAAGKYLLRIKEKDVKKAKQALQEFLLNIETFAKKEHVEFSLDKGK